jgi:hypothetical protein
MQVFTMQNLTQKFVILGVIGILATLILVGCGENLSPTDTTPPSRPDLIPRTNETEFIEQGIDADPGTGEQSYWIRIEWEWNTESDLFGYYVYRMDERDSLGIFAKIVDLRVGVNLIRDRDPIPYYVDQDLVLVPDQITGESHGFYYYIRAYDTSDNSSAPSDTAYYRLMQKPTALTTIGSVATNFSLSWTYYSQEAWDYFFIRIYPTTAPQTRVWSYRANLLGGPYSVIFNTDGTANTDFFRTGTDSLLAGNYTWSVDVVNDFDLEHPAGAESKATFIVAP